MNVFSNCAVHLLLHRFEVRVLRALREFAAEDLLPVRAPLDLLHALTGDERARARDRRRLHLRRVVQVLVVERERLVVVVDLRQVRVGEDLHQQRELAALPRLDLPVRLAHPAAVPAFLVLPLLRIADARLRLDVVEPRVLDALAVRPHVLAGDRARMAADALVEVQHHPDLSADLHVRPPPARGDRSWPRARRANPPCSSCARRRTRRGSCRSCRSS